MLISRSIALIPALLFMAACSQKAPPPPPVTQAAPEPAPAAPAEPVVQNVYKFTIGALPAFALRDGGLVVPNDNKTLAITRLRRT